jgi:ESCRT-I complex subunit VPS37
LRRVHILNPVLSLQRFDASQQMSRLRAGTTQHDDLSESIATSFCDGGLDEDTFVRQYMEVRKVYHQRAMQVEKWNAGKVAWR